jgi:two-component system response regulator NreC
VNPIRIILADDHVVVRQGLRSLLDQQKDMQVVGEADDGLQLLESVAKLRPNVAVVDLKMPYLDGIHAAEKIRIRFPDTHVVILTMHADRAYIERAIHAGVCGYVLKEENIGEMCTAIRYAARGEKHLSAQVSEQVLGSPYSRDATLSLKGQLTPREYQVFLLVAEGKTNADIAELLNLSIRTAEGHRAHIKTKLNLKTQIDFFQLALKNGLIVE